MSKIYQCECGRLFDKPNSLNGHKSHCVVHLHSTGRVHIRESVDRTNKQKISDSLLKYYNQKSEHRNSEWVSEQHHCEKCGVLMTEKFGSGRFCSRSCANSRPKSEDTKEKLSHSVKTSTKMEEFRAKRSTYTKERYYTNPNHCQICGSMITYENRHLLTCGSNDCLHASLSINGRMSILKQADARRSQNEALFCEMCENIFDNVEHNKAMFDGWDADVIIHDFKIAVLWNGNWHYKQIKQNQSIEQIQQRDKLKEGIIRKCGYLPYIIKDEGGYNPKFVEEQFQIFLNYVDKMVQ